MIDNVLGNLINIGWAMLIFVCSYLSNVLFSLYYNIKILDEPFDTKKLTNSAIKVSCIIGGLTCLVISTTCLPEFANMIGWTIPDDYVDVFSSLAVLSVCLVVSCKYIFEAIQKFTKILNIKENEEVI